MKKVYLGAFVLFAGMTVSAQQNLTPSKFSNFFPVEKKKVVVANNEKADVLWESTMDNQADWVSESISSNSSVTWVWKNNPSGIPNAAPDLYPFASATASNGFFVIDSDGNNNADFNGTQITATLTSPTIDLTGEDYVRLQFQHNFRWWKETRKVRISIDNGTTWQDLHIFSDNAQYYTAAQNTANPEITTIDISAIAGGQSDVKVQFFFDDHDYWGWYWVVDDVKILRNEEYDLSGNYKHNHFNGYEYSQIPATQVSPLTFEANAKNAGIEQLTGIQMTVDVNSGASTLTSNVLTLDANQEDTLSVTYNVPSTAGTYTFSQSISMDQTDLDMSNNLTFTPSTLTVGEFIYATDLGAPYAAANYSTITLNGVGVGYDIYNNATLYGIDFVLTTGTATDGSVEVYGELREYNTQASSQSELWNFVAETDPVIIASASDLDAVKTLSFPTPVNVTAGKTYLAFIKAVGGTAKYAYSGLTDVQQPWLNIEPDGTNDAVWYPTDPKFAVRMNFDPSAAVASIGDLEGIKVYPNPTSGLINVSNDLNIESTIVVTDLTGKVVASKVASNATTIDLNNVGAGVFLVEISNANGKKVERVIVK